jgi:hypothetical protein
MCLCHHRWSIVRSVFVLQVSTKRAETKWNRDFYCEMKLLNLRKSWVLIINLSENHITSTNGTLLRCMWTRKIFQFPCEGVVREIKAHSLKNSSPCYMYTNAINLSSESREATDEKLKIKNNENSYSPSKVRQTKGRTRQEPACVGGNKLWLIFN